MSHAFSPPAAGGLPAEISPFVGRKEDIARLLSLLGDPAVRLVSILGPGGTGKTRLALELAPVLQPSFTGGVVFVPLADLGAAGELLPALSRALGVLLLPGSDLRQAVFDHLNARQLLLILDNFEHLLDGAPLASWPKPPGLARDAAPLSRSAGASAAPLTRDASAALLVRDLLAAAPQVKVLVTSHEKLNLTGETLYHLQGLALPPAEAALLPVEYDAVRLFVQKARQASPGFTLEDANAPAVLRICRLVDGMPLGILLAAAWVELFSLEEIAGQIEGNLDFLSAEVRDLPARHRSLRAVFNASYDRLEGNLPAVLTRLSVFRGGFTLPAAQAVAAAELKDLLALVDRSLLRRDPSTARCSLHNMLGRFALDKLVAAGGYPGLRNAHAAYYLDLLHRSETALKSDTQLAALDAIQADFENIRLAWTWAVEKRNFYAIQRAARSLYAFCDMRGRHYEGDVLFRQAWQGLAPAPGELPDPDLALLLLSWFDQHDYIEKLEPSAELGALAQACLEQARTSGSPEALAASLVLSGVLAEQKGDFAAALPFYQQGHCADATLDAFYWVELRIGICHQQMGEYDLAIQTFQRSLERSQALGERVKTGWALFNIGETMFLQGKAEEAAACLRQAHDLFQETGTPFGYLWCDYDLARISLAERGLDRARRLAEAALQLARQAQAAPMVLRFSALLGQINAAPVRAPTPTAAGNLIEPLSERELEVLRLLKTDMSGPEIASQLMVSLNTVRYHTKNIYQKLQVNTRRQALARARELGL